MELIKKNGTIVPVYKSAFSNFFDIDKFFDRNFLSADLFFKTPAINIIDHNDNYMLEVSVPGFEKNEVKVHIEEDILTIEGEKKSEKKEETDKYNRREFSHQSFSRSMSLPNAVDPDKITAETKNGILYITIPKLKESKSVNRKEVNILNKF